MRVGYRETTVAAASSAIRIADSDIVRVARNLFVGMPMPSPLHGTRAQVRGDIVPGGPHGPEGISIVPERASLLDGGLVIVGEVPASIEALIDEIGRAPGVLLDGTLVILDPATRSAVAAFEVDRVLRHPRVA